jgi:hypothetical protein
LRFVTLYIALFGLVCVKAQPSSSVLRVNELEAALRSDGLLFDSMGTTKFRTRSGLQLANRAGIWISAKDSAGNIMVSTHDVLGNNGDFSSGPLEIASGQAPDPAMWNKVYPVTAAEIAYHQSHYNTGGYTVPQNILNWPGSSAPPYAKILAPFVDYQDSNQVYEPLKGDYPYIISDGLVYGLSNEKYNNAGSMGIELHTSLYGFDQKDSILKNCILVRYSVHNRSGKNYDNFRLSSVINFKIGVSQNEFLGTDVRSKAIFAVNDTSEATFSNKLVSMGCMLVNRKISSTMYFNDNNDPISGRPISDGDYYNLMQGRWKSGKQLTYFGNGVDGSIPARYVYPYTSDASHGDTLWSEESTSNIPGQRLGIMNTDSTQLKKGEAKVYDFVYFFVEKNTYNVKRIGEYCLKVNTALAAKNLLDIGGNTPAKRPLLSCFPNPAKAGEKLTITNVPETALYLRLIGLDGQEICKLNLDINNNCIILPHYLSSGMYMIEYKTLNTIQFNKLIINN